MLALNSLQELVVYSACGPADDVNIDVAGVMAGQVPSSQEIHIVISAPVVGIPRLVQTVCMGDADELTTVTLVEAFRCDVRRTIFVQIAKKELKVTVVRSVDLDHKVNMRRHFVVRDDPDVAISLGHKVAPPPLSM